MSQNRDFYERLSVVDSLSMGVQSIAHTPIPDDWHVVCADVKASTKAIESGSYRAVNAAGASVIVAVLNIDRSVSLPYIFEGDGALIAIPPELVDSAQNALIGARALAREQFDLELVIGIVSAEDIRKQGAELSIAKVKRSASTHQAAFSGDGWRLVELTIKSEVNSSPIQTTSKADFSGFECRWGEVPARLDHKLSLIVSATALEQKDRDEFYKDFLDFRTKTLGDSTSIHPSWHPLQIDQMNLQVLPWKLLPEAMVRASGGLFSMMFYAMKVMLGNIAGLILFALGKDTKDVEWSRYLGDLVSNSDYEKFSSRLMMVLDVSTAQADALENYLSEAHESGRCLYGTHRSPTAIITCYIREYNDDHVHFVDGGNGGYTAASIGYKAEANTITKHS